MNNKLKTLTLITTGLVVGVVIGRVGINKELSVDSKDFIKAVSSALENNRVQTSLLKRY